MQNKVTIQIEIHAGSRNGIGEFEAVATNSHTEMYPVEIRVKTDSWDEMFGQLETEMLDKWGFYVEGDSDVM